MFADQRCSLAEHARLNFRDLALIVRIADVKMGVRDNKDGPFSSCGEIYIECFPRRACENELSGRASAPFRHFERKARLAEVFDRWNRDGITFALEFESSFDSSHGTVKPYKSVDHFR